MATNVTQKDKTLNEIIDWAKSRCHEAGLSRFDVRRKSDRDFYDGQVNAFHEMLELCRSLLGYSGSMPSEVPKSKRGCEMSAYQPVLDPACGGRMFWFDKSDDRVLFGDVRDESWELCDGRRFDVKPDMLMDYRDLPFPDGTFRMVVLDRPTCAMRGKRATWRRNTVASTKRRGKLTSRPCSASASAS